ncbi:MAG: SRPBCC domain-containing protein, partial [Candidatus Acidiferrales bacterium]
IGIYDAQEKSRAIMSHQPPLNFTFYIAAGPEKVWDGFLSRESNRIIFSGADFKADLKPGGNIAWVGPGPDGKPVNYVRGKVLRSEPPKLFSYTFAMGENNEMSRVTLELAPETEATKVTVTHDEWAEGDSAYAACADGWPRILSRLKTLIETGKTFKPH